MGQGTIHLSLILVSNLPLTCFLPFPLPSLFLGQSFL